MEGKEEMVVTRLERGQNFLGAASVVEGDGTAATDGPAV